MGINASTSIKDSTNKTLNKVSNDALTEYSQEHKSRGSLTQTVKVVNGETGEINCGEGQFIVINEGKFELGALGHMKSENIQAIANDMLEKFTSETEKTMKAQNSKLNLGQTNIQTDVTKMHNSLENIVEQSVKTSIKNSVKVEGDLVQTVSITNYGIIRGNGCRLGNVGAMKLVSDAVTDGVMKQIADNKVVKETLEKYKLTMESKNVGINPLDVFMWFAVGALGLFAMIGFVYGAYYIAADPSKPSPGAQVAQVIDSGTAAATAAAAARGGGGVGGAGGLVGGGVWW